jgi:hypothetical protein
MTNDELKALLKEGVELREEALRLMNPLLVIPPEIWGFRVQDFAEAATKNFEGCQGRPGFNLLGPPYKEKGSSSIPGSSYDRPGPNLHGARACKTAD